MGRGEWEEKWVTYRGVGGREYRPIYNLLSWKDIQSSHFNCFFSGGVYPTDPAWSWVESIRSGKNIFFLEEFRDFQSFAVHVF